MTRKGFTLIELLVVVAIIAVLAAVAVPNLLEAQIRSKASRAVADIRTVATGLEAYCVDHGAYPMCNNEMLDGWRPGGDAGTEARYLERLSTPVAYISRPLLRDPFAPFGRYSDYSTGDHHGTFTDQTADPDRDRIVEYKYGAIKADAGNGGGFANQAPEHPVAWIAYCAGPDRVYVAPRRLMESLDPPTVSAQFFDPTNGTVSYGDIWRAGGQMQAGVNGWGGEFFRQLAAHRR